MISCGSPACGRVIAGQREVAHVWTAGFPDGLNGIRAFMGTNWPFVGTCLQRKRGLPPISFAHASWLNEHVETSAPLVCLRSGYCIHIEIVITNP